MSKQNDDIRVQLAALFEEHDYNKRYERLSVVYYMVDGKIEFYQAIKDVPRFTPISDTRVWNKSTYDILTNSEEPTFDNDFIPVYFSPEVMEEQVPAYYVETLSDDLFITNIMASYVVPNQTTQPEITGVKINNVPYTLVSSEDDMTAPGLAVTEEGFIPIDEEMYEEFQYIKQMGVNIDANIGDGVFDVIINALSDTAPSGSITFELNTDVGNCTIIVPGCVEPTYSYIYIPYDSSYYINFTNSYNHPYDDQYYYAYYSESDIGSKTTITVSGDSIVCTGWQESSDGETWIDIPNSATNELEVTIPEDKYYYKPIVVSTEPNWVEISRELDGNYSNCITDADDLNTGLCTKSVTVTYQDQNPYSSSYNQTRTSTDYTEIEDLVSCPIPQNIVTKQVQLNIWTEFDDDGTILTNDSSKATICDITVGRSFGGHSIALTAEPITVSLLPEDTEYYITFMIHLAEGYGVKAVYTRLSANGEWVEHTDTSGLYRPYVHCYKDVNISNYNLDYFDYKIELCEAIYSNLTLKAYSVYNDGNGNETTVEENLFLYHGGGLSPNETIVQPLGEHVTVHPFINCDLPYDVYEQYVRYSENDSWTQIPLQSRFPLDLTHDYIELKYMLHPPTVEVTLHFATASTLNGETVYNIDDTLGTLYDADITYTDLTGTSCNPSITFGINNFSNIDRSSLFSINVKAIPSQSSNTPLNTSNIDLLYRKRNATTGLFENYDSVTGNIETQNGYSYIEFKPALYLSSVAGAFSYPNKVEILVVFTPEQQSGGTTPVYQKVTSAPANGDWSGDYIIMADTNPVNVFDGNVTQVTSAGNMKPFHGYTFGDDISSNSTTDGWSVHISESSTTNEYYIQILNGQYFKKGSGTSSLSSTTTQSEATLVTIEYTNNETIIKQATTPTVTIRCKSDGGSIRFTPPTGSFYTGSLPIYLYKKVLI